MKYPIYPKGIPSGQSRFYDGIAAGFALAMTPKNVNQLNEYQ